MTSLLGTGVSTGSLVFIQKKGLTEAEEVAKIETKQSLKNRSLGANEEVERNDKGIRNIDGGNADACIGSLFF